MRIHLVNPGDVSFGTAVITPRWQYVIAAAPPDRSGTPVLVDETLDPLDEGSVQAGDLVGIHATLLPDEVREHGEAHAVVTGDGDLVWPSVLDYWARQSLQPLYDGGWEAGDAFSPARWDPLPRERYMCASVQTLRGCSKHCAFCSVWRTDGQKPDRRQDKAQFALLTGIRDERFELMARLVRVGGTRLFAAKPMPEVREPIAAAESGRRCLPLLAER